MRLKLKIWRQINNKASGSFKEYMLDALFIVPGNAKGVYQSLSEDYSAIETPTWALLLAESCRSINFKVNIIDVNAERLSHSEVVDRIIKVNPRYIVFVVYGQNVNAGTTSMSGAVALSNFIKLKDRKSVV